MSVCTVKHVIHELHPTLLKQMREHYDSAHEADSSALDFEQTIKKHIRKAQAFCEASLARAEAYKSLLPLKSAATISVISAECKIAAYYASAAFSEKEEILIDKYNIAIQQLDWLVEANNPALIAEDEDVADAPKASFVTGGSDPRVFTREELEKW